MSLRGSRTGGLGFCCLWCGMEDVVVLSVSTTAGLSPRVVTQGCHTGLSHRVVTQG